MTSNSESPRHRDSLICCAKTDLETESSSTSGVSCGSAESNLPKTLDADMLKIRDCVEQKEVESAIVKCKEAILSSAQCSEERKWLVRYLIELRYRLEDLKENSEQPKFEIAIKGHHFKQQTAYANRKQYCDHCSGVVWSIVQSSYCCEDCGYLCHQKCIQNVIRVCAHVTMTENARFEMDICPETGLASQEYKCAECKTPLTFKNTWNEPRLCDYSGLYYCATCHWNDTSAIPARVVHNWDWDKHYVSRVAYQMLKISWHRPYIDLEKTNPKLFNFIPELEWIHKMRKDLEWMRRYLCSCEDGHSLFTPLFLQLGDVNKKYSMAHLKSIHDGNLESELTQLTEKCRTHITNCELCSGKGYLCEICSNNEILYPFDRGAIMCYKCNSMYHRGCWLKKSQTCIRCKRLDERRSRDVKDDTDSLYQTYDIDKFVDMPSLTL